MTDRTEIERLAAALDPLIRFGPSSWTYPGWVGDVYEKYPSKWKTTDALREVAKYPLFRTAGADSFHYRIPDAAGLRAYAAVLPAGFPLCLKVVDSVTAHTWNRPDDPADRRGKRNWDWLNPQRFVDEMLGPVQEHLGEHLGPLMFEIRAVPPAAEMEAEVFAELLDQFFAGLPRGPQYAVELRNPEFYGPAYRAALRAHGVAHLFNSWERMPSIAEQFLAEDDPVTADFIVARALLKPGRKYQAAVKAFEPYDSVKEVVPEIRDGIFGLARTAVERKIPAYLLINNRAEGNSPGTIRALAAEMVGRRVSPGSEPPRPD